MWWCATARSRPWDRLTVEVAPGENVAVIGASGSGNPLCYERSPVWSRWPPSGELDGEDQSTCRRTSGALP